MIDLEGQVRDVLLRYVGEITTGTVMKYLATRSGTGLHVRSIGDRERLAANLRAAARLFVLGNAETTACLKEMDTLLDRVQPLYRSSGKIPVARPSGFETRTFSMPVPSAFSGETVVHVETEDDVVVARGFARELARRLGFSPSDQVKVATATSELARNIVQYAGRGQVTIRQCVSFDPGIEIIAEDQGSGIVDLEAILSGNYRSKRGMGRGLLGTRAIMDDFDVKTAPNSGTRITIRKLRKVG